MVTTKRGNSRLSIDWRIGAKTRAGTSIQNTMPICQEVAQACIRQHPFDAFIVSTFWQPNSFRRTPEVLLVMFASYLNLCPNGLGIHLHQRKIAVGGTAGDDFQVVAV